jgi:cytochrome c oxidase subunit II
VLISTSMKLGRAVRRDGSGVDRSMQLFRRLLAAIIVAGAAPLALAPLGLSSAAHALGTPSPWEMGMQPSAGPIKTQIIDLNDLVMVIITVITLFVGVLLLWVVFRYNARRNPTPSRTSHNSVLEIAWTVLPVLILVIIAIPSFRLVYYQDRTRDPDMTIKVTGHQWYWEYTYPDHGNLDFTSYIVPDDQLKPGQLRLLAVDNELVVPVGKNIRVLTTSADVIHSFFVPALGVQRYAIPGRLIETWFKADKTGVFYGECNQICGQNHSRMPIAVHAVTDQEFTAWLEQAKTKFADTAPARPEQPVSVAAAQR